MKQFRIQPEYYDLWGAYEGNDIVTDEQIEELAREWDKAIEELMEQVNEIDEEEQTMKPICTINLNEDEGRQTISWNPVDGMLYSTSCEEPVDGYTYDTIDEAVEAADIMWGRTDVVGSWDLEWIEAE